jgi:hypothetical protein
MHPRVICQYLDGSVSALICERHETELHARFVNLLQDYQAVEVYQARYDEPGISHRAHQVGPHRLESGWSYGEFSVRGPVELVAEIVAALCKSLAEADEGQGSSRE